jgi:tRNA nucleotidyltransferase/poly(A) polymerase
MRAPVLPSLKGAPWLKRKETRAVFDALSAQGAETRAVGGPVRDTLLGRPVGEIDLATTLTPDRVTALAAKAGLKVVPTGIDHGTVTVVANGHPFEVTTLRRDVETFGRHARVAYTDDWEEDARRRDFTLNALYADREGRMFDPLGGLADLREGRVRFIGDPEARIKEDFLRILRFFRFNAYYGQPPLDPEGLAACVKLKNGLAQLSGERLGGELRRILVAPRALETVEALYDYGLLSHLLGAVPCLTDLQRLVAIETALGREPDAALRLAALSVLVTEDVAALTAQFRLSNAEQAELALAADQRGEEGARDEAKAKAALYRMGPSAYAASMLVAWARSGASIEDEAWRAAIALPQRWQAPAFPLRGGDLVALGGMKGPKLGTTLRRLEREWIDSGFVLSRDELLARAKEHIR